MTGTNFFQTLDKIDNLVVGIKVFKSIGDGNVLDEFSAKWQESTSSKEKKRRSTRVPFALCALNEQDLVTEISRRERNIDLSRKLVELTSLDSKWFSPIHSDSIGIPVNIIDRWKMNLSKSVKFGMKFIAKSLNGLSATQTLCTIQYYGNGHFSMQPSFTAKGEFHEFIFENENYYYQITNESESLTDADEQKEQQIFEEFFKRLQISRQEALPFSYLEGSGSDKFRYLVHLEVESAANFEADYISIKYLIDLNQSWETDNSSPASLEGITQMASCERKLNSNSYFANFGFPLELNLLCADLEGPPIVYFKVLGLDNQNRERVGGYGYLQLGALAGTFKSEVLTWKPKLHFQSKLKSTFLGGSPDLLDLKYIDKEAANNNHYGLQTESSGTVHLKYNIIVQNPYN